MIFCRIEFCMWCAVAVVVVSFICANLYGLEYGHGTLFLNVNYLDCCWVWGWQKFEMSQKLYEWHQWQNFPKSNNTQTQAMHKICTMCELNSIESNWKILDVVAAAGSFFVILDGRACEFSLRIETMWTMLFIQSTDQLISNDINYIWNELKHIIRCDEPQATEMHTNTHTHTRAHEKDEWWK